MNHDLTEKVNTMLSNEGSSWLCQQEKQPQSDLSHEMQQQLALLDRCFFTRASATMNWPHC